jgi:hypothetical protein
MSGVPASEVERYLDIRSPMASDAKDKDWKQPAPLVPPKDMKSPAVALKSPAASSVSRDTPATAAAKDPKSPKHKNFKFSVPAPLSPGTKPVRQVMILSPMDDDMKAVVKMLDALSGRCLPPPIFVLCII